MSDHSTAQRVPLGGRLARADRAAPAVRRGRRDAALGGHRGSAPAPPIASGCSTWTAGSRRCGCLTLAMLARRGARDVALARPLDPGPAGRRGARVRRRLAAERPHRAPRVRPLRVLGLLRGGDRGDDPDRRPRLDAAPVARDPGDHAQRPLLDPRRDRRRRRRARPLRRRGLLSDAGRWLDFPPIADRLGRGHRRGRHPLDRADALRLRAPRRGRDRPADRDAQPPRARPAARSSSSSSRS